MLVYLFPCSRLYSPLYLDLLPTRSIISGMLLANIACEQTSITTSSPKCNDSHCVSCVTIERWTGEYMNKAKLDLLKNNGNNFSNVFNLSKTTMAFYITTYVRTIHA